MLLVRARQAAGLQGHRARHHPGRLRARHRHAGQVRRPRRRHAVRRERHAGSRRSNIHYGFGVDGIAALLLFLTTLLGVIVIIGSWNYVKDREMGFFISLLLLRWAWPACSAPPTSSSSTCSGRPCWCRCTSSSASGAAPRRIYAAIKFFLFTLVGSLLMLVAIIVVVYYVKGNTRSGSRSTSRRWPRGVPVPPAVLGVPRLLPGLRHQGADVPAAHLAAGRARRGAHGRLGDPRRRAAEDGRVRHPALLPAVLPGRRRHVHPLRARPLGDRHRLRGARVAGPEGPQEAGRLLEREPHGLRDAGHLRSIAVVGNPPAWTAPSS